jgi:hypothetical protein
MARPADPRIVLLVEALDRAFSKRGWQGPTLRGAFRGMTPRRARWRPAPGRHSAWELLLHAAYWKYAVRRGLGGAGPGGFRRSPANWPDLPRPADARALARDLRLLGEEHRLLVAAVRRLRPRDLARLTPRGEFTWAQVILGAAAHDSHHGGQVQLLKRLQAGR